MAFLSEALGRVAPSATVAISQKARDLAQRYRDVPPERRQKMRQAMRNLERALVPHVSKRKKPVGKT